MNVNEEFDKIEKRGFRVVIRWGKFITITSKADSKRNAELLITSKHDNEKWEHCMYRAVLRFDEKYPELS